MSPADNWHLSSPEIHGRPISKTTLFSQAIVPLSQFKVKFNKHCERVLCVGP